MAKTFKYRLRELLSERRPHQSEASFAKKCGIRQPTINAMCNNEAPSPKLVNLARICEVLPCTIDELLVMVEEAEEL